MAPPGAGVMINEVTPPPAPPSQLRRLLRRTVRRVRDWAKAAPSRFWRWLRWLPHNTWRAFKRLKAPAKWVVSGLLVAFVAAAGTAAGTNVWGLFHDPSSDYAVTVDANPDHIQTKTGVLGGSYVIDQVPEAAGAPPGQADSCADRYDWAHGKGGVDASSTTVSATVEGANDNVVKIEGITPRLVSKAPPRGGSFYTCGGRGEESTVRAVTIDLDQPPPLTAVSSDAQGNLQPLQFQVQQSDVETFQITATTGTCDCKWDAVLHLVAEGHRYDEVIDDHGRPFETTAPSNAVSYRWMDGAWARSDSTAPGTTTTIAPIDNACDLITTSQASSLVGGPVVQTTPAPAVQTNGVTTKALLVSTCSWDSSVKVTPTGAAGTETPSVACILDGLDSAGAARAEYEAQLAMFGAQAKTTTVTIAGTDQAAQLPGVVLMLKGRLVLDVQTSPAPTDQTGLLAVAAAAAAKLNP